jgi:hypothetical protein
VNIIEDGLKRQGEEEGGRGRGEGGWRRRGRGRGQWKGRKNRES